MGIIELTLLESKALFSSFCMIGNNSSNSSVSFEFFFRHCRGIHFFNLQGKRFTENKLKSSDHEFNMFRKCHT